MVRPILIVMLLLSILPPVFAQTSELGTVYIMYVSETGTGAEISVEINGKSLPIPAFTTDFFQEVPAGSITANFTTRQLGATAINPITFDLAPNGIAMILLYHDGTATTATSYEMQAASEKESPWYFLNMLDQPFTVAADGTTVIGNLQPGEFSSYLAPMRPFTETSTAADGTVLTEVSEVYGEPYYVAVTVFYAYEGEPYRFAADFITTDVFRYLKATSVLETGYDFWTYLELLEETGMITAYNDYGPETTFIAPTDTAFAAMPDTLRNDSAALQDYLLYLAYDNLGINLATNKVQVVSKSGKYLNFATNEDIRSVQNIPLLYYMPGIYGDVILIDVLPMPYQ